MEPHQSGYPDESGTRWYRGDQQFQDTGGHPQYESYADQGGHRAPEPRSRGRAPQGPPPTMGRPAGPWPSEAAPGAAQQVGRTSRSAGRANTRRTLGVAIAVPALVAAIPILKALVDAAFGSSRSASGVISTVLMLLGLPLAVRGLLGLATGAATATPYAWLRPPVAYLTVALVLFVAAGLAAT